MPTQKILTPFVIGFMAFLVLAGLFFAFNPYADKVKQEARPLPSPMPYQATLSGVQTCLPHKDTSGPQTLECAIGMMTVDGKYYALDFNLMSSTLPNIQNNERFTASGVITPIEELSSDQWQKYDVEGIFSVTVIETAPEPAAPTPVAKKCFIGGCSSEVCSDQEGIASNCMYREEYACYKTAKCEQQAGGECGWTETAELKTCLNG